MTPASLALAAPAALAAGAYLRAKTQIGYDCYLLGGVGRNSYHCARRQAQDRVNFFYVIEEHATSTTGSADRIFLIFEGREWTYRQAYDAILKCGTWLKRRFGVRKEEVVAMDFMNGPLFVFLWFGLWSIGAYPAFINYNLTAEALLHTIKVSQARLLLVDPQVQSHFTSRELDALQEQGVEAVFFDEAVEEEVLATTAVREPDSARSGAEPPGISALIYTSGTTGLPKAAVFSWRKIWTAPMLAYWMHLKPNDRSYTCMPLYHSSAIILCTVPAIFTGATLVLGRRFSTATFWPEVRASGATTIQYVGETCRYLLAAKPQLDAETGSNLDKAHKVRLAVGNGLRPDVWDRFKSRFGVESIGEFYSATEGVAATWNYSSNEHTSGAIGRGGLLFALLTFRKIAVVKLDWDTEFPLRDANRSNFCTRVPRGEAGELIFRLDPQDTKDLFAGYYDNPKASEAKILRDVFTKGDAFFRTGDVVRWDLEGRWFFCDRIGDTFRWKSENVSTAQVGEALGLHPRINEANVYGVEVPHHDGRAGCAAVLFTDADNRPNIPPDEDCLLADVAQHAFSKLPRYAVPSFLRIVKEFVATGTNKQQKVGLRRDGIDPGKVGGDRLFWLRGEKYVPFEMGEYGEVCAGMVRL